MPGYSLEYWMYAHIGRKWVWQAGAGRRAMRSLWSRVTVPGYTRDLFCRVIHSTGKGLADFRAVGGEGRPCRSGSVGCSREHLCDRCANIPHRPWGILTVVKRYQHRGSVPAGDLSLRAEPLKTGCEGFARSCGGGRAAWIEEGLCLSR